MKTGQRFMEFHNSTWNLSETEKEEVSNKTLDSFDEHVKLPTFNKWI